jgi:hypothetical protein
MAAPGFVGGRVAQLAERVQDVGGFPGNDAIIGQAPEQLFEGIAFVQEGVMGSDRLAEQFSELA